MHINSQRRQAQNLTIRICLEQSLFHVASHLPENVL